MRATLTENHRSTQNADVQARSLRLREAMPLAPGVADGEVLAGKNWQWWAIPLWIQWHQGTGSD